jgi:hypothetical protein
VGYTVLFVAAHDRYSMLTEWLSGSGKADAEKATGSVDPAAAAAEAKRVEHRKALEAEPEVHREQTADEQRENSDKALRKKLIDSAKEPSPGPNSAITFDGLFRTAGRLLISEQQVDFHDGLQLNLSRQAHNMQVSSKWQFGNPQAAGWDVNLQMNGFGDVTSTSYSTLGRFSLMHQRVFKSGALMVAQFMVQPQAAQMGAPPGTLFFMMQWPWIRGGCTQFNYLRSQHVQLSHTARLMRGVHLGAQMQYDTNTHDTAMSYGLSAASTDKTAMFAAQATPDKGEWKVAMTKADAASDVEMVVQLERVEKQQGGLQPALSIGLRKPFIGGAVVSAVMTQFQRLKVVLDLPFGCGRAGINEASLQYTLKFDAHSGGVKHGLALTL